MNSHRNAAKSDFRKRLTECLQQNGGHLSDVIFGRQTYFQ
jgi:hypothetical protein